MPLPRATDAVRESRLLATGLLALGAALVAWQWFERRRREAGLSAEDRGHFARKDARRLLTAAILALIAGAAFVSSRIDPRTGRAAGRAFIWLWVGVLGLVGLLLVLALLDWRANRAYGLRKRRDLIAEHWDALSAYLKARRPEGNPGPSPPTRTPTDGLN